MLDVISFLAVSARGFSNISTSLTSASPYSQCTHITIVTEMAVFNDGRQYTPLTSSLIVIVDTYFKHFSLFFSPFNGILRGRGDKNHMVITHLTEN